MKKAMLCVCLFMAMINSRAQSKEAHSKWAYSGLHQAGLMTGSKGEALSVLTTNGLRKGNWFTGITTGVDWYNQRSIPLLGTVYKAFGSHIHQPFVYGSAGIHFPWVAHVDYVDGYEVSSSGFKPGFMGEAGIGYFIHLKKGTAISIGAGYSYKAYRFKAGYTDAMISYGNYYTDNVAYHFRDRRLAFRLGFRW